MEQGSTTLLVQAFSCLRAVGHENNLGGFHIQNPTAWQKEGLHYSSLRLVKVLTTSFQFSVPLPVTILNLRKKNAAYNLACSSERFTHLFAAHS